MRTSLAVVLVAALIACKGEARKPPPAEPAPAAGSGSAAADPWAAPARPPAAAQPVMDKPFFYAATRGDKTLYLLGTMHIGVDANRQLPPWVFAKLDGARAFAMETDLSDPAALRLMARTDGKKLSEELSPEDWKRLQELLGPSLAEGLDAMIPFATLTTLSMKDLPFTAPMDGVLLERAKAAGKPIVYLEPIAAQLAAITPFATAADIHALLGNLEHSRAQTLEMARLYVAGDGDGLLALFADRTLWTAAGRGEAEFAAFLDATLTRRNQSWIEALEKMADDGGGFVAVGAAHLIGPSSVPELLAARGFTVTRLTADGAH